MASRAAPVRQTCCCFNVRVATIALAVYHIVSIVSGVFVVCVCACAHEDTLRPSNWEIATYHLSMGPWTSPVLSWASVFPCGVEQNSVLKVVGVQRERQAVNGEECRLGLLLDARPHTGLGVGLSGPYPSLGSGVIYLWTSSGS